MARTWCVALLSLLAVPGCLPRGEPLARDLYFGYSVGERVTQPGQTGFAVAVESRADLEVFVPQRLEGGTAWLERGELSSVSILDAVSENDAILRVVDFRGSRVTVEGRRPGTTRIRMRTERGLADLTVGVAEPTRVDIGYLPRDGEVSHPTFLVDGTARFRMVRRDASGRLLGGQGTTLPVRVDPPGSAHLSFREGDTERVDVYFDREGELALRPLGGEPFEGRVVRAGDGDVMIDVIVLDDDDRPMAIAQVEPGTRRLVVLTVRHDDGYRIFGLIGRTSLATTTPGVCEVDNAERWHSDGVYELYPRAEGACVLSAAFGELAAEVEITVARSAPPVAEAKSRQP